MPVDAGVVHPMDRRLGMDTPDKKGARKPGLRRRSLAPVVQDAPAVGFMPEDARQWAREFVHEINQPLAALLMAAQACRRLQGAGKRGAKDVDFGPSLDRVVYLAERVIWDGDKAIRLGNLRRFLNLRSTGRDSCTLARMAANHVATPLGGGRCDPRSLHVG